MKPQAGTVCVLMLLGEVEAKQLQSWRAKSCPLGWRRLPAAPPPAAIQNGRSQISQKQEPLRPES